MIAHSKSVFESGKIINLVFFFRNKMLLNCDCTTVPCQHCVPFAKRPPSPRRDRQIPSKKIYKPSSPSTSSQPNEIQKHVLSQTFWSEKKNPLKKNAVRLPNSFVDFCRGCEKVVVPQRCPSCGSFRSIDNEDLVAQHFLWGCVPCGLRLASDCLSCFTFQQFEGESSRVQVTKFSQECWTTGTTVGQTIRCCNMCEKPLSCVRRIKLTSYKKYMMSNANQSAQQQQMLLFLCNRYFNVCDECCCLECPERVIASFSQLVVDAVCIPSFALLYMGKTLYIQASTNLTTDICLLIQDYRDRGTHCKQCRQVIFTHHLSKTKKKSQRPYECSKQCAHTKLV